MRKTHFVLLFVFSLLVACTGIDQQRDGNQVTIRIPQDPSTINPLRYRNTYSAQIINLLYQSLYIADIGDKQIKPLLVKQMAEVREKGDTSYFTFEIRPEARWDDGSAVTWHDVAFSLKLYNCPLLGNEHLRPAYASIINIAPDDTNDAVFTLTCLGSAAANALTVGDFFVVPRYLLDAKDQLRAIPLSRFVTAYDVLRDDETIQLFAQSFDSVTSDFSRLAGSGAYLTEQWQEGQYIRLRKKENWWGASMETSHDFITANPDRIQFQIITENQTAMLALKNEQIDVFENIPTNLFHDLQQDKTFLEKYKLYTPETYRVTFMALNARNPKLSDKYTRQALAHLLDTDQIIRVTTNNFATRTIAIVNPSDQQYYHPELQPYSYDVEAAKALLLQAGWQQKDGKWFRANENTGKSMELTLELQYIAGSSVYENTGIILQKAASLLGIPIQLVPIERRLFSNNLRQHQFELSLRSLSGNPFNFNYRQILHSSASITGGSNWSGFGTAESDSIITLLALNGADEHIQPRLWRLQELLYDEANLVFLYFSNNRIAVHNRFDHLKISSVKPHFDVSAFRLKD